MSTPIRHTDHDDIRILKLPQWARAIIAELRDESRKARDAMELVIADQPKKPDWHDHEFFTREHENNVPFERYFRANSLHMRTDTGIRLNIVPRDDEVTIYYDEGREAQKLDLETILTPGASNCVRLRLAKVYRS